MRFILSIALLLAVCVSATAQDKSKPLAIVNDGPPAGTTASGIKVFGSVTISAERVEELKKPTDEARTAQTSAEIARRDARIAELSAYARFLEAVLDAAGIDLSKMERTLGDKGQLILSPKKEEKK